MDPIADFQPESVIRLLGRHGVRYVLIGGLAAVTHGAPLVTQDVDLCYARDADNVDRLVAALREVNASAPRSRSNAPFPTRCADDPKGRCVHVSPATSAGWTSWPPPAGTSGYEDLARTADAFDLFGYRVLVAAVDDLIRMKRAAGRPKDLLAVEELGALRDELDRRAER